MADDVDDMEQFMSAFPGRSCPALTVASYSRVGDVVGVDRPEELMSTSLPRTAQRERSAASFGMVRRPGDPVAETGLLIRFFLPGDSLLFTAGLLCAGAWSACT